MPDVYLIKNRIPEIRNASRKSRDRTMFEVGTLIVNTAMQNIVSNDTIDTGNMLNSGYVQPFGKDRFPSHVQNPGLPLPRPKDADELWVNFAAGYSVFVELGTVNSDAYPFLGPAVETVRPKVPGIAMKNLRSELT